MSRTVLIVQARIGSQRLPGKTLMDLAGETLIYRVMERAKRCTRIDRFVLATPLDECKQFILEAEKAGFEWYGGSESDCLSRTFEPAWARGANLVVRIPGDNPCIEPAEVDRIIGHHMMFPYLSFSTNIQQVFENGYPDGIGAEVVDFELLQRAWQNHHDPDQREHVHRNFFDYATGQNYAGTPVNTVACPREFAFPDLKLDVNTRREYQFMKTLYEEIYPKKPQFHITDILRWLRGREQSRRLLEQSLYTRERSTH